MLLIGLNLHAEQQWRHEWNVVHGPVKLLILTGSTEVILEPAPTPNSVSAFLESNGWSLGKTSAIVEEHQREETIQILLHDRFFAGVRFCRLHVLIPGGAEAELRSSSGSILLNGIDADIRFRSQAGELLAQDVRGALEAKSNTGRLQVKGEFSSLRLETRSGAINCHALPGSKVQKVWRMESHYGSVAFTVPPSLSADLDVQTNGTIHSNLPLGPDSLSDRHRLEGELNGGGPLLAIWSHRGDIRLTPDPNRK